MPAQHLTAIALATFGLTLALYHTVSSFEGRSTWMKIWEAENASCWCQRKSP